MKEKINSLQELTATWMAMERKTFAQRQKAEQYYYDYLMDPIVEDYKKRNKDMVFEQVEYLILSVGTSYEPLVLNISLLSPIKILFLYTEESETVLNKIVDFLKLAVDSYEKRIVEATDSLSIYHEIKRAYVSWNRPSKVYIDFTGGTKTMSAAAALASTMISVQLVYVGTENYLTDFRKPAPGSENLYYIDNPIEVFGDLELEKVFALIEKYNYAGAAEKLYKMKETIPDPVNRQQIDFVYLLVKAYEHWDALEFPEAYEKMVQLLRELRRDYRMYKNILLMDFQPILKKQYEVLKELNKIPALIAQRNQQTVLTTESMIIGLMFTMYENAMRREEQEKYDMATLLLYRLLEMIMQKRLMRYGIFVTKPDYTQLDYTYADPEYLETEENERLMLLKSRNLEFKKALFPRTDRDYLPSPIALLDGYTLLAALGDKVCVDANGGALNQLRRIRSMVSLRNNSIFAHGLGPVGEEDYKRFRGFVQQMFEKFCEIEQVSGEFYREACRFLNPLHSGYYKMMGENA